MPSGTASHGESPTGEDQIDQELIESAVRRGVQNAERLKYVADMILELKQITERDGYGTLSGILALAHAEASHKRD